MSLATVILCGGSGSRLWPLSREAYPKQFLNLTCGQSLLEETIARVSQLGGAGKISVVSNEEHRFLVAQSLEVRKDLDRLPIILEPVGRNTAPAISVAAMQAIENDPDSILLVLPADHVIGKSDVFVEAVDKAKAAASEGKLVTFGIVPDSPHTGYGYIKANIAGSDSAPVEEFVEKPDQATAQTYLDSGKYYWNSGMFMFRADRYLQELKKFRADIYEACEKAYAGRQADLDFMRVDKAAFEACPDDSIDYAVMEKTQDAVVIPLDAGWSDVGSWSTLWEIQEKDGSGNVKVGDVITEDVEGSYIHSEGRLIAAIGLKNHVIVETDDVVMVADKDRVQDVKKLVAQVKAQDREEYRFHKRVHRPWGTYEGIARSERFQVKRITVKPGGRLSLQKHHHRAEHWVIVSGTAKVTRGEEEMILTEDQSTYIPLGVVHRLENPGVIPVELIEVQTGSYLGEDDIVRFDDTYGRA
ncbi:mannose-1-phosphate guanylyltransferase/mannose-6-phosphate isomerase [Hahella sp. CCB-MM4]|uniref:mannose-1-phosphate guanylyltransferase/mannose-6-phosphate isomerase n=1 Tax=Hahella sp. (strain CCB-MM4) TaxID=1926491 RepID=UPI000B9C0D0F|nr:mannose-1-phosphate guanylyltransferase/mannose-6-phosphate isomerase [Hahella sp. CCB-MM4]OZG73675.1 mannose-1-phosphate guanylyltransferase/mannose-6-phosphate isomerase [Hahella sp. CCB-MM4]